MRCFVRGLKAGGRACGYRESVNLSPSFTAARNMHTSAPRRAEGSLRGFGFFFFFLSFTRGGGLGRKDVGGTRSLFFHPWGVGPKHERLRAFGMSLCPRVWGRNNKRVWILRVLFALSWAVGPEEGRVAALRVWSCSVSP